MSNSTRTNAARLSALESDIVEIKAMLRTLAGLDASAPAKVTRPKAAPKAKPQVKAPATRCLTRKNRVEFVKAHPWAQGLSTQVIAAMATEDPSLLGAGWAIGERYQAKFA